MCDREIDRRQEAYCGSDASEVWRASSWCRKKITSQGTYLDRSLFATPTQSTAMGGVAAWLWGRSGSEIKYVPGCATRVVQETPGPQLELETDGGASCESS